jgi:hypothetical protein
MSSGLVRLEEMMQKVSDGMALHNKLDDGGSQRGVAPNVFYSLWKPARMAFSLYPVFGSHYVVLGFLSVIMSPKHEGSK